MYIFGGGHLLGTDVPFVFPDGVRETVTPTLASGCYLIQHPDGLLLWDTGLPDALIQAPRGAQAGDWRLFVTMTLSTQLKSINIEPRDIDYLGFSHLHADHTGNANLFGDATVLLHAREREVAVRDVVPENYHPPSYRLLESNRVVALTGDYDLFGDGSVQILEAPGHTPGHQVLAVDLPLSGSVVFSGDLYYSESDRITHRMPAWNVDYEQTLISMKRIEQYVASRNARLLIHHNREQISALPHAPEFLS